jgi:very-short-patch-repair endonuclease
MLQAYSPLAERQRGVVTRAQLLASGLSPESIDRRLRNGELASLHQCVYALAGVPDSFERQLIAAVLAGGDRAAASHRAAAFLHGIGELPRLVEISLPASQRPRLRGVTVYRVAHLPPEHLREERGIRVTSRARALCDLASVLTPRDLELTLDHALARRRFRLHAVRSTLASLPPNTKGAGTLRALLAARPDGEARAESPLELDLHDLLGRAGLDGWRPQVRVSGVRVDVAFPDARLALQLDSYRHHSSRSDWVLDHGRNSALVATGWRVLHVTQEDLRDEDRLVARIRQALWTATVENRR